jgi:hypothetical protein
MGDASLMDCPEDPSGKTDAWISQNCSKVDPGKIDRSKLEEYRSRNPDGWVEIEP